MILNDPEVHNKLIAAKKLGKPIDGHAPGLTGEDLKKYIAAGISTDHECTTLKEAKEKIGLGMKVLIREGSAARNLDTLKELIRIYPSMVMLCSDDMHPETLEDRHINKMVAQLISEGFDVFNTVRSCTINPAIHYNLDAGLLRPGDPADFIIVDDLKEMNVEETWINGEKIFEDGRVLFRYDKADHVNKFRSSEIAGSDIRIRREKDRFRVIEAQDGDLITKEIIAVKTKGDYLESDPAEDILKIVVKDRYNDGPPAIGFIRGFGLKRGAFASSVAHDSHNIICIGVSDQDIINAVNEVVRIRGGLSVADGKTVRSLQLGIAGIMTDLPVQFVAGKYEALSVLVRAMGCKMSAPFMTLSFMALLVIPELKLSDKGLFDGKLFRFVPLFTE
ncbi:MAG: adenine deaminase [Bacteroidales bacterium]|nr:adenine deaminase [Bacteroidales bacterium]